MAYTGEIRMIKWGIIPQLPSFQVNVGQTVGGKSAPLLVVEIISEPLPEGKVEYHVLCERLVENETTRALEGDGKKFIWKTYKLNPDEVQYFTPDGKHDYIKI